MSEGNGNSTPSRLDRLEAAMNLMIEDHEQFRQEHKMLLKAQVIMQDILAKLGTAQTELAIAQKATEEKLNFLITTVDGMMRRQ